MTARILAPQAAAPPKLEVGMVDPHINETVTHVAELDEDAIRRQNRSVLFCMLIPALIVGFCIPPMWIMVCCLYFIVKNRTETVIRATQVYLTERALVGTMSNQPMENRRVTIPLANIASVMVQPGVMTVNIKPTAPQVKLNRRQARPDGEGTIITTVATRTVPIYNLKNAEDFAKVIQGYLN